MSANPLCGDPIEGLTDLLEQRNKVYNIIEQELQKLPLPYYKKITLDNVSTSNELQHKQAVISRILEILEASELYMGSSNVVANIFTHGKLKRNNTLHLDNQNTTGEAFLRIMGFKGDRLVLPKILTKNIRLYSKIVDRIRMCSPKDPEPQHRLYAYNLLKMTGFNTNPAETIKFLKNELNVPLTVTNFTNPARLNIKQRHRQQLILDLLTFLIQRYKEGYKTEYESNKELLKEVLHELPITTLIEVEAYLRTELETADPSLYLILAEYTSEILKIYIEKEVFEQAEAFLRKDIDRLPKESNELNSLLPLLISVLQKQKKNTNAAYILKENYEYKKQTLSLSHPNTQNKLKAFIEFLTKTGQYAIAEGFLEKEIATVRGSLPVQQIILLLSLLANVFLKQKKYDKVEEVLHELFYTHIEIIRKTVGSLPIDINLYPVLKNVYDIYIKIVNLQNKDPITKRIFEVQLTKALGPVQYQTGVLEPTSSNAQRGVPPRIKSASKGSIRFVPETLDPPPSAKPKTKRGTALRTLESLSEFRPVSRSGSDSGSGSGSDSGSGSASASASGSGLGPDSRHKKSPFQ